MMKAFGGDEKDFHKWDKLLKCFDDDGNGEIDFDEFKAIMSSLLKSK
jgi:Ca2+-binding EF-hand superfamily protein